MMVRPKRSIVNVMETAKLLSGLKMAPNWMTVKIRQLWNY